MEFYKVSSPEPAADYLSRRISGLLTDGKKVLWLVPGGSAIKVAAGASSKLSGEKLQNLTVTLTDERYGPPGHADSNWQQLKRAGFALDGANLIPVLTGKSLEETTGLFDKELKRSFAAADYSIGLFGIGPDGHTAGILPGSPAIGSRQLAASFTGPDFERITITPAAIAKLTIGVVYATGGAKWPVLGQLSRELPLDKQPAQALKAIPKLRIYNDYKGEEV